MPHVPTLYKARRVPTEQPVCAISVADQIEQRCGRDICDAVAHGAVVEIGEGVVASWFPDHATMVVATAHRYLSRMPIRAHADAALGSGRG